MVGSVTFLPVGEPSTLDRYQLIGEIASGGMAVVYLARLVGVGGFSRLVAIKRLHPHLAGEREFVEMFVDEARLAAGIHHQNVVGLKEIGMTDNGYYLVMDYIDGVTLATLLSELSAKKRKLPIPIVLRLLVDTLSGLHAAHELVDETTGAPLGVVHRDCTPQNILVGMDGSPRLTDFGIARATSRIANTRDGAMKGKLAYMAPEQTKGDGIDRRADLFSVGVVMWEALSGRRLFRGSTEAETLRRLLVEPIPSLLATAAIHQSLSDVCAVALEREPAERFQTAVQMIEAIEEAAREWGKANGEEEPIAPVRAVAALMKDLYDAEASEQREAVRRWVQAAPQPASLRELTLSSQNLPVVAVGLPELRISQPTVITAQKTPHPSARASSETAEEDDTEFYNRVTTVPDALLSVPPSAAPPDSVLPSSFAPHADTTPATMSKAGRITVVRGPSPGDARLKWWPLAIALPAAAALALFFNRAEVRQGDGEGQGVEPLAVLAKPDNRTDAEAAPSAEASASDAAPSGSPSVEPAQASPALAGSAATEPAVHPSAEAHPPAGPTAESATAAPAKAAPVKVAPAKAVPAKAVPAKAAPAPAKAVPAKVAPAPAKPPAAGDDFANPYR